MKKKIWIVAAIIVGLFAYRAALAGVIISEIMYDAAGSDTGAEWIEIYNDGGSVDLTGWKLFEADTNHGMTLISGNMTLGSGDYAVIALDTNVFSSIYGSISGALFDSSFSLINTGGEYLAIKDPDGNVIDDVTYDTAWGASDDGNTLSYVSGSWSPAMPTPGEANSTSSVPSDDDNGGSADSDNSGDDGTGDSDTLLYSNSNSDGSSSSKEKEKSETLWSLDIVSPLYGIAGDPQSFVSEVYNSENNRVYPGRVVWNFGDGTVATQEKTGEITHTYYDPGTYVIYVEYFRASAFHPEAEVTSRLDFEVHTNTFTIREGVSRAGFQDVILTNKSGKEIDLGGWRIVAGSGTSYTIPDHTIALASRDLVLSGRATGFESEEEIFYLYDPSDTLVVKYPSAVASTETKRVSSSANTNKYQAVDTESETGEVLGEFSEEASSSSNTRLLYVLGAIALMLITAGATVFILSSVGQTRKAGTHNKEDAKKYEFE